jgi:carbon storage regulator
VLVLTRKTNESLVIGENISITILAIEGEKVKIGIEAPRDVSVLRQELWLALKDQEKIAEQIAAASETPGLEELRQFLVTQFSGNGNGHSEQVD